MCTVQLMKYIEAQKFSKFTIDSSSDEQNDPLGRLSFRAEFSRVIVSDDFKTLCFVSPTAFMTIGDIGQIEVEEDQRTGYASLRIHGRHNHLFPQRDFLIWAS